MRIRRRLTVYGVIVTGVTMLAFGVLLYGLARGSVPDEQDKTLAGIAEEIVTETPVLDVATIGPGLSLPVQLEGSLEPFTAAYDSTGSPLYSTATLDGATPTLPAAVIVEALDKGVSIVTAELDSGPEVRLHARAWPTTSGDTAVLAIGQSTEFVTEQVNGLVAVVWVAALLAMLASVLVSYLVSGRALRPLHDLAVTTDEIGRTGDLSRRLPPVATRDEVGTLTSSFNGMLDEVEKANTRLSEALNAQRRFVADASHELRSPLTTIRSNAGFLAGRPDAAASDRTDAIADISAEADRMATLVDDLLTLAVRDAGKALQVVPIQLTQVIHDLRPRAETLSQQVEWSATTRATVHGDRDALTRLVWILIDNAARHGATRIAVTTVDHPSDVSIVVSDNGPGFPADSLDRVFERFYRGDPARSPAGAGLGLSIAAALTSAHGGQISAANAAGGGAVVTVTLPRDQGSSSSHRGPTPT